MLAAADVLALALALANNLELRRLVSNGGGCKEEEDGDEEGPAIAD